MGIQRTEVPRIRAIITCDDVANCKGRKIVAYDLGDEPAQEFWITVILGDREPLWFCYPEHAERYFAERIREARHPHDPYLKMYVTPDGGRPPTPGPLDHRRAAEPRPAVRHGPRASLELGS